MDFKLLDSNRFYLQGTNQRFLHLASIIRGIREYIFFLDMQTSQSYIEEITGGDLEKIEDDELWDALANFIKEKKIDQFCMQEE